MAAPQVVAPPPTVVPVAPVPEVDMDVEMEIEEELPPAIDTSKVQVRADFNPRARPGMTSLSLRIAASFVFLMSRLVAPADIGLKFVTPSGQQVSAQDVEEHMKIETANIRALEERKKKEQEERPSKYGLCPLTLYLFSFVNCLAWPRTRSSSRAFAALLVSVPISSSTRINRRIRRRQSQRQCGTVTRRASSASPRRHSRVGRSMSR